MKEHQGKNVLRENISSLYQEGSRPSVNTFGVAACTVCPETDVVFPCCACACVCARMYIHLSDSYCVRGAVDSKSSQPNLVHVGHVAVAEQTPFKWASKQEEHPWIFIEVFHLLLDLFLFFP